MGKHMRAGSVLCQLLQYLNGSTQEIHLDKDVDWEQIHNLAVQHRIVGYLGYHYLELRQLGLDDALVSKWSQLYRQLTYRQKLMEAELKEVLSRCRNAPVALRPLLLKGAHVAHLAYPGAGCRWYNDIDFLVADLGDLDLMGHVLRQSGYKQFIAGKEVSAKTARNFRRAQHDLPYIKNDLFPIAIDVHWRLHTDYDTYQLSIPRLFGGSKQILIGDTSVRCLSNEDTLIHLCLHLFWHTRSVKEVLAGSDLRLSRFLDIDLLIRTQDINWRQVFKTVDAEGIRVPCAFALVGSNRILDTPMPDEVTGWLSDPECLRECNGIADRWLLDTDKAFAVWNGDIFERIFDLGRGYEALKALYTHLRFLKGRNIRDSADSLEQRERNVN